MSFLIQRTAGRGLTLTQVQAPVLRIGRGTNQELRSENPAVALEHAVIEVDSAGYVITDKGSITGTYVNRRPVESARLAKGDVIEIGDLRVEVQLADPAKPLFLRVVTTRVATAVVVDDEEEHAAAAAVVAPGARVVRAKKIDYAGAYRLARPYLTKLSLTAILLILALGLIGALAQPENQRFFRPGDVSSAHARAAGGIGDRCDACHTPWRSVDNNKCKSCHAQQAHATLEKDPPACSTCHAEHRAQMKLANLPQSRCTSCHANLGAHVVAAPAQLVAFRAADDRYDFDDIAHIASFDTHPDFRYLPDRDTLRFNHKLHLAPRGIFNASGRREILQCVGCHEQITVKGKTDPAPIRFEKHCQRCHRLTFDARFGDAEVPHGGDPGIVYGFVVGMYTGNRDLASKSPEEVRRMLTTGRATSNDPGAVLHAEQVIKTKCTKCHDVQRAGARLAVTKPVLASVWLTRSRFSHGPHRNVACESCHRASNSVATSDVIMPHRDDCVTCHAQNAKTMQAASTCLGCHEYHQHTQRPVVTASLAQAGMGGLGSGGRMLQGILLAVIVVLLLVVLVPVGIALFQRLRPERSAPAPRERATPAPPPPPAMLARPDGVTDKVPRQSAPPPPDLTPRAAEAPAPPSTVVTPIREDTVVNLDEPKASSTEMVQWYGMLNCTGGPLEGQRFIIDEAGFYIGRDPALAKVVVPDTRVSKRHLRIVPRDGKVWAIDQGSTNGTFLTSAPTQRITEVQLKRGDTLVLGDNAATFIYQI
ncbi:MAG: FHA domain-containing protein [Acidobacteria bacterium]|nr:FHA domain-containing protein [Acidobacteriota bacterium]MBV9476739.1 FHA domain-containing protein [Acidobacteriota bacterium]